MELVLPESADNLLRDSLTSTYLLEGLKDPGNGAVWQQYVDRYRPLLVAYSVRLGLRGPDADDATQQILIAFCQAYQAGKYDRERGRLRDWLFGIARNQILNSLRRRAATGEVQIGDSGESTGYFERIPDDDQMSILWEEEFRKTALQECLMAVRREVEPRTFEAFDLFACQGWSAAKVAEKLGITPNAVFGAKRRVLRRARELLVQIESQW